MLLLDTFLLLSKNVNMRTQPEPSFIVDGIPIVIKERTSGKLLSFLKMLPSLIGEIIKRGIKNQRSKGTLSVAIYPSTIVDDKERQ